MFFFILGLETSEVLTCKHCSMKFTGSRGFKRHVMLKHLKCYNYLCPHCDRSAKSESLMIQHIQSKHPGQAENVVYNPNPRPKINDAFWQSEYGLRCSPKKKLKQKQSDGVDRRLKSKYECKICHSVSLSLAGFRSHAKTHERELRCAYCTFATSNQSEMSRHSELNHPNQPVKYEVKKVQGELDMEPEIVTVEDYTDDIEEEEEYIVKEDHETDTVYKCGSCDMCSISQESIRIHWNKEHKAEKNSNKEFKYVDELSDMNKVN